MLNKILVGVGVSMATPGLIHFLKKMDKARGGHRNPFFTFSKENGLGSIRDGVGGIADGEAAASQAFSIARNAKTQEAEASRAL